MAKKEKRDDSVRDKLNINQEAFCRFYSGEAEFFGNGVESYGKAYGIDITKSKDVYFGVAASASRLLKNAKVIRRINEILVETGFSNVDADKQLSFLMHQHADLPTKLGAIREFNKLMKRIDDAKINIVFPSPILGGIAKKTDEVQKNNSSK
jgi:hypothetical protein